MHFSPLYVWNKEILFKLKKNLKFDDCKSRRFENVKLQKNVQSII